MHGCSSLDHVRASDSHEPPQCRPDPARRRGDLGARVPVPEVGDGARGPAHVHRRARRARSACPCSSRLARARARGRGRCRAGCCRSRAGAACCSSWRRGCSRPGIRTATVTNTGFLTALYVVITPFIAWGWNGKRPNAAVWPAVALSAFGTWLLGGGGLGAFSQGDMLVALSAVFWAAHVVITGRAAHYGRPIGFTAVQFAVVTVLAVAALLPLETVTLAGLGARPSTSPTSGCCRAR